MKTNSESVLQWNKYVSEAHFFAEKYRKPNGEKIILENIIPINEKGKTIVPEEYECPFLNKELWISATGNISPCCAPDELRKSLGDFGNIDTSDLKSALESQPYQNLVNNYKNYPLCKTCNMRKPQ